MLDPVLGARDASVNKTANDPCPLGADIFLAKTNKKENSRVKLFKFAREEKSNYMRGRVW